jgi:hypothetical protein
VAWLTYLWTQAALVTVLPSALQGFAVEAGDMRVAAITVAMVFGCAILASVAPAIDALRIDVSSVLNDQKGRMGSLRRRGFAAFLAAEAVVGVWLVLGASATVPRFVNLLVKDPGYDAKDLYAIDVNHNWSVDRPLDDSDRAGRVRTILEVLQSFPGVVAAGATLGSPIGEAVSESPFWMPYGVTGEQWGISGGLLHTLSAKLLAGQAFSEDDVTRQSRVAVLNLTGARVLWPGEPLHAALGRTIQTASGSRTVIGVVDDLRRRPGEPATPALFLPITAAELSPTQTALPVLVRMAPGRVPDARLLNERLNGRFPSSTVQVQSIAAQLELWLERPRLLGILFAILGGMGICMTASGLYAIASFEVIHREEEMAVRSALGATTARLRARIVRLTIVPTLVGIVLGLLAGWLAGGALSAFVADIDLHQPYAHLTATVLFLAVALAAAWIPARRVIPSKYPGILRAR